MTGLALAWLVVIGCLIASILIMKTPPGTAGLFFRAVLLSTSSAEATALVLNIFVALLTDSMGYIQAHRCDGHCIEKIASISTRISDFSLVLERVLRIDGLQMPSVSPLSFFAMLLLLKCLQQVKRFIIHTPTRLSIVLLCQLSALASLGKR